MNEWTLYDEHDRETWPAQGDVVETIRAGTLYMVGRIHVDDVGAQVINPEVQFLSDVTPTDDFVAWRKLS